jgi:DNA polymerase delta subunit 1
MADTHMVGCSWIELRKGSWKLRGKHHHYLNTITRCQLEVDVAWDQFIAHAPEGEWSKVAPFRILSFDIECAGRKGMGSFIKFKTQAIH